MSGEGDVANSIRLDVVELERPGSGKHGALLQFTEPTSHLVFDLSEAKAIRDGLTQIISEAEERNAHVCPSPVESKQES